MAHTRTRRAAPAGGAGKSIEERMDEARFAMIGDASDPA